MIKKRKKDKTAYTRMFGLWPSGQGGTSYIFAQIQRRIFVFVIRLTNSDTIG